MAIRNFGNFISKKPTKMVKALHAINAINPFVILIEESMAREA